MPSQRNWPFLSLLAALGACAASPHQSTATTVAAAGAEHSFEVVALRYTLAQVMVNVLQQTMTTPAPHSIRIAADQRTNRLVLAGTPADLEQATALIERLDQPNASDVIVLRLQHAAAQELAGRLGNLFRDLEVVPYGQNFLLSSGASDSLERLRAIVSELDRALGENP